MTGFEILDLVIGTIFVYFLLSLMCVSIQEAFARYRDLRTTNLKAWLLDTFNWSGAKLGDRIWCNKIVDGLTQARHGAAYLSTNVFVHALLDEIHSGHGVEGGAGQSYRPGTGPYDFQTLGISLQNSQLLPDSIKRMLQQFHKESNENLDAFKLKIGKWFDEAMERNAGTYRKKTQNSVLVISFALTLALNVDSITLFNYFYENKAEAARIADAAEAMIKESHVIEQVASIKNDTATKDDQTSQILDQIGKDLAGLQSQHKQLTELGLPIGWGFFSNMESDELTDFMFWFLKILGWIITGIAVSLGAPFWFDTLNKLVNLRSSGKKPEDIKSNEIKTTTSTDQNAFA